MAAGRTQQLEAHNPLPRFTKCIAKCSFNGEGPNDLSFETGDVLIILKPDKAMFWYIAKHSTTGQEGLIPITLTEVMSGNEAPPPLPPRPSPRRPSDSPTNGPISPLSRLPHSPLISPLAMFPTSPPPLPPPNPLPVAGKPKRIDPIDTRPPMPLPPSKSQQSPPATSNIPPTTRRLITGKYSTIQNFYSKSGWFRPTVDMVLCNKASMSLHAFRRVTSAIYYFQHKYDRTKHFVGKSLQLYNELTQLFSCLYEKSAENLNPLEMELRFHSSEADQWNFRMWQQSPSDLDYQCTKLIIQQRSLKPLGLNREIMFVSKDDFSKFCVWYTEERRKNNKRAN